MGVSPSSSAPMEAKAEMEVTTGFDHAGIIVASLSDAERGFTAAGFAVVERRQEGPRLSQRFIGLGDRSYLELLEPPPGEDLGVEWIGRLGSLGTGFGGYYVTVPDCVAAVDAVCGTGTGSAQRSSRRMSDGGSWALLGAALPDRVNSALPDFIEDVEGRRYRSVADHDRHPNGARGVSGVVIATDDPRGEAARLAGAFGSARPTPPLEWSDGEGFTVMAGDSWIAFYRPRAHTPEDVVLQERGGGISELSLYSRTPAAPGAGELLETVPGIRIRLHREDVTSAAQRTVTVREADRAPSPVAESPSFPQLFSEISIGGLKARNRIVNSGHGTALAPGRHNEALFAYEEERARGGAAMVITQSQWLNPSLGDFHVAHEARTGAYDELARRIQSHGALSVIQINHSGRQTPLGPVGRDVSVAPSQVAARDYGSAVQIPHAMSESDIWAVVDEFAEAVVEVSRTRADGVELHFGHGNLVQQFLGSDTNRRTDGWGGSLTRRMRFAHEVLTATRERVGPEYPLGVRINGSDPSSEQNTADLIEFAQMLSESGQVDYLSVSGGHFASMWGLAHNLPDASFRAGLWEEAGRRIRAFSRVPVILVGRINTPELAEHLIATQACDMVAMVRELLADPYLPQKAERGEVDSIRPCVGIQSGCWQRVGRGQSIQCAFNPEAGREAEIRIDRPTAVDRAKSVVVVGAGPAGLEAARYAAVLGHRVTLIDESDEIGGQLKYIARTPKRADTTKIVAWFDRELIRHEVEVRLGEQAGVDSITQMAPDAVVLATGSRPGRWPGEAGVPVWTVRDAFEIAQVEGRDVLVFDEVGGRSGLSAAEYLAAQGAHIRYVTSLTYPGQGLDESVRGPQMSRLAAAGVTFWSDLEVVTAGRSCEARSVLGGPERVFEDVDALLTVLVPSSRDDLAQALESVVPQVLLAGDALAPRGITEATHDGRRAASALGEFHERVDARPSLATVRK